MRYTDLTNDELDSFLEMSKLLSRKEITCGKFIEFFNELQYNVLTRKSKID